MRFYLNACMDEANELVVRDEMERLLRDGQSREESSGGWS